MEGIEISIDQIPQQQDPASGFQGQPNMDMDMPPQQMTQQQHQQYQQAMNQQQALMNQQMPVPDLGVPSQPSLFGRAKEFMGQKSDYLMAIPIFLVVVAVLYFAYPKLASYVPMVESVGKILFSVVIGIIVSVIFLVVKSKTA